MEPPPTPLSPHTTYFPPIVPHTRLRGSTLCYVHTVIHRSTQTFLANRYTQNMPLHTNPPQGSLSSVQKTSQSLYKYWSPTSNLPPQGVGHSDHSTKNGTLMDLAEKTTKYFGTSMPAAAFGRSWTIPPRESPRGGGNKEHLQQGVFCTRD